MVTRPRPREGALAPAPGLRGRRRRHAGGRRRHHPRVPRHQADTILEVVTYDSTTIHNTIAMAETFRMIGYPPSQGPLPREPRRLDRRHRPERPERALGRRPEHRVGSDGPLVVHANNEGVPFVLADPSAPDQPGRHAHRRRAARGGAVAGRRRGAGRREPVSDPRPIGVFDSGVGGLTVLREILRRSPARIDDLPRRQRAGAVRRPARRGGPAPSRPSRSTRSSSATSRRSSSPATPRPRSRSATSGAATTCRSSASSGRARRPRRSRPATAASASSPRPPRSARTPTSPRSRTRTRRSRSTSTRRRRFVPMVEAGLLAGPEARGGRRARRSRRCSASATRAASSSSRCRPRRGSTRCCSAARTTRCCGRSSRRWPGSGSRSSTPRRRRRPRSPSCCRSTASRRRGTARGTAGAGRAATATSSSRPATSTRSAPSPSGCSARRSADVEPVELEAVASRTERHAGRAGRGRGGPRLARRPALAGRLPPRLRARRRRTVLGRRAERIARRGLVDWGRRARRRSAAPKAPGEPVPGRAARRRRRLRRGDGAGRAALSEALGTALPGVVERAGSSIGPAGSARTSARSGAHLPLEGELLDQVVPEGGGLARRRWRSPTAG